MSSRGTVILLILSSSLVRHAAADAPSLAVRTDAAETFAGFGVSADVLGVAFGDYDLQFDLGLSRHFGLTLVPGFAVDGSTMGPSLAAGASVWPLGRGLDGWSIAVSGRLRWLTDSQVDLADLSVAIETGYGFVWRGMFVGAAAGARLRAQVGDVELPTHLEPLVRLRIGFVW